MTMLDGTTALMVNGNTENSGPVRSWAGTGPNRARLKKERPPRMLRLHQPVHPGPNRAPGQTGPDPAGPTQAALKAGRRELLKSKGGRAELSRAKARAEPHRLDTNQNLHQNHHQNHHQNLHQNLHVAHQSSPHLNTHHNSHRNEKSSAQHRVSTGGKTPMSHSLRTKPSHRPPDSAPPRVQDPVQDSDPVQESAYAGPRFSEPPAPSVLPPPPPRWVPGRSRDDMSLRLKALLRVQD